MKRRRGQTRGRRHAAAARKPQTENTDQENTDSTPMEGGGAVGGWWWWGLWGGWGGHLPLGAPQHASVRQGEIGEDRPGVRHANTNTPPWRHAARTRAEDRRQSERATLSLLSLSPLSTPPPSLICRSLTNSSEERRSNLMQGRSCRGGEGGHI